MAESTTVLPLSVPPVTVWVNRLRPPPNSTSKWLSTSCSAIEPSPPTSLVSLAHAVMSAGPWQPRSEMCAPCTAGVASVSSAVVTSPTFWPRFFAFSITDS